MANIGLEFPVLLSPPPQFGNYSTMSCNSWISQTQLEWAGKAKRLERECGANSGH